METFSKSDKFLDEYSATVVRIGKLEPIKNSDFLAKTQVAGFDIVVRKDQVKEGDIQIYCPIETQLRGEFLSKNNLFSDPTLNSNCAEYNKVFNTKGQGEAKKLAGFFGNNGRIRIITLRGQVSMGFIFDPKDFLKWDSNVNIYDLKEGESFDTVNGKLFIRVYYPNRADSTKVAGKKHTNGVEFVNATYREHYDTAMLNKNMARFNPDTVITISEKMDGTSWRLGYVPVRIKLPWHKKLINFIRYTYPRMEYKIIPASRRVIYYSNNKKFCNNIYRDIASKMGEFLDYDEMLYGEALGYYPDSFKPIAHKNNHIYDYGVGVGKYKIIIYRAVIKGKELNLTEVNELVNSILKDNPEYKGYLEPVNIMYCGKFKDLYPDIPVDDNWRSAVLERMKNDPKLLMEQDSPRCKPGTPSEGIVVRIVDDTMPEAFKLKCIRYQKEEAKDVDKGILTEE